MTILSVRSEMLNTQKESLAHFGIFHIYTHSKVYLFPTRFSFMGHHSMVLLTMLVHIDNVLFMHHAFH